MLVQTTWCQRRSMSTLPWLSLGSSSLLWVLLNWFDCLLGSFNDHCCSISVSRDGVSWTTNDRISCGRTLSFWIVRSQWGPVASWISSYVNRCSREPGWIYMAAGRSHRKTFRVGEPSYRWGTNWTKSGSAIHVHRKYNSGGYCGKLV